MKAATVSLLLLGLLFSVAAVAQTKAPLTNEDVLKMVNLGFEETTIIKALQANEANFDTSVEGLLALRNAGVSKNVMDAMLDAQAVTNKKPDAFGGLPRGFGVYYRGDAGWTQLPEAPAAKTRSKGLLGTVATLGKTNVTYVYRGAHAPVQFKEAQPAFYIRGLGKFGRDAEIIRLEPKADTREVEFASESALWGSGSSSRPGNVFAVNVARIADDALIVTPSAPLKPGEYLLSVDPEHTYDFGIAGTAVAPAGP